MTYKTLGLFALAGAIAWTGATLFFAAFGSDVMRLGLWLYIVIAAATGVVLVLFFRSLAKARRIDRHDWLAPVFAFAAPSVLLSIAFAPGALRLFENAPEVSGQYGAYIVFAYMLVMAVAVSPRRVAVRA